MEDLQHVAYTVALRALKNARAKAVENFMHQANFYDEVDPNDVWTAERCIEQAIDLCIKAERIVRQSMQSSDIVKAVSTL